MPKRTFFGGLIAGLVALSVITTPALAADPDPALPEWSGSVLGGAELTFPPKERVLNFAKISSNTNFSLGLDTDGRAWAWGVNGPGQLGNTDYFGFYQFIPYVAPMYFGNDEQLVAKDLVAGGNFSIVLDLDGKAWSYGSNVYGQLANPSGFNNQQIPNVNPVPVLDQSGEQMSFDRVEAGTYTGYGIEEDGKAWTWGRNENGELGNSGLSTAMFAARFPYAMPLKGADGNQMVLKQISVGEEIAIAIDSDGKTWGWGRGNDGQLGPQASASTVTVPVQITDDHGTPFSFTQVAAGRGFAIGIDLDGNTWSWGLNDNGRLGNPAAGAKSANPVPVVDEAGVQQKFEQIETGLATGFGIKADGSLWSLGAKF